MHGSSVSQLPSLPVICANTVFKSAKVKVSMLSVSYIHLIRLSAYSWVAKFLPFCFRWNILAVSFKVFDDTLAYWSSTYNLLFFSFSSNGNLMSLRTSSAVLKGGTWVFKYIKSFSLLLSFLALISFFSLYPCSCKTEIFSWHCFITSLISFAWNFYFL